MEFMKKTTYFPHDYGARNDDKIVKLRANFNNPWGYGLYWMFIESMHETSSGYIDSRAIAEFKLSFGLDNEELMKFIGFCIDEELFMMNDDGKITTPRVQEHKEFRGERSESGRKGAKTRDKNKKLKELSSASSSATGLASNQLQARKEKKRKEKNNYFKAPALEEVAAYCKERNNGINAQAFIDHYQSNGWMRGKSKIKDWKACVRTWETNKSNNTPKVMEGW